MATVTGFTAEKMQEIVDQTIESGTVDGSGHLILITHDETEIDAGSVVGPQGPPGDPGGFGGAGGTVTSDIIVDKGAQKVTIGGSLSCGEVQIEKDAATGVGATVSRLSGWGQDSTNVRTQYGYIDLDAADNTDGSEDGAWRFNVLKAGVATELFGITGIYGGPYLPNVPLFNNDGSRSLRWGAGSPEGVVSSSPGGKFFDITNGLTYIKRSGTGTTGWVCTDKAHHTRVYRNAALSVPNNTPTAIALDIESADVNNWWTVGAADRIIPTIAGYYLVIGHLSFVPNATGLRSD